MTPDLYVAQHLDGHAAAIRAGLISRRTPPGPIWQQHYDITTAEWRDMDADHAIASWRRHPDPRRVIQRAHDWTGGLDIPRMRVINCRTGLVVWYGFWPDNWTIYDPTAGMAEEVEQLSLLA